MAEGYASRVERSLLIIVFLVLWFLPLMIAGLYKLPHQGRIAVLSIALGWTGVAWLAALTIVIGGAIRATEPPAQRSREWPDSPVRPQARAPDMTAARAPDVAAPRAPDMAAPRAPDMAAPRAPDIDAPPGPTLPPSEQQPAFPPVRSPWPGRQQ
jgi:Superinfection immunity protein